MRQLASVQRVLGVNPVENSDNLDVVQVLGWKCVTKRGEFKEGDLVVYVEVDAILPEREEFEFMRSRHFRVKTVKLRGQISQGLVFPLSVLGEYRQLNSIVDMDPGGSVDFNGIDLYCEANETSYLLSEGSDVTEILNIKKYEPEVPSQLRGQIKGGFPSFLHKTDETRVQNLQSVLNEYQGTECYVTEKLDGSSMTVYLMNGEFGVCSRNIDLKETADNQFWKTARSLDLENRMKLVADLYHHRFKLKNYALQGELIGPGIQGNKYNLNECKFMVFNVFDIDNDKYLDFKTVLEVLHFLNLLLVPIVDTHVTLHNNIDELVEFSKGKSFMNPNVHREGIVIRPLYEIDDVRRLGRLSMKVINPDFLLKYQE